MPTNANRSSIARHIAIFELIREAGLEGMVAKRRQSKYEGALKEDWLKIKCLRVHDFVVGGWIPNGRRPGALLLGEFVDGHLRYVGEIGSESDAKIVASIARDLIPRSTSPFTDRIANGRAKFCEPVIRVSVEFLEFTDDGYLRQASFRRFTDELVTAVSR